MRVARVGREGQGLGEGGERSRSRPCRGRAEGLEQQARSTGPRPAAAVRPSRTPVRGRGRVRPQRGGGEAEARAGRRGSAVRQPARVRAVAAPEGARRACWSAARRGSPLRNRCSSHSAGPMLRVSATAAGAATAVRAPVRTSPSAAYSTRTPLPRPKRAWGGEACRRAAACGRAVALRRRAGRAPGRQPRTRPAAALQARHRPRARTSAAPGPRPLPHARPLEIEQGDRRQGAQQQRPLAPASGTGWNTVRSGARRHGQQGGEQRAFPAHDQQDCGRAQVAGLPGGEGDGAPAGRAGRREGHQGAEQDAGRGARRAAQRRAAVRSPRPIQVYARCASPWFQVQPHSAPASIGTVPAGRPNAPLGPARSGAART